MLEHLRLLAFASAVLQLLQLCNGQSSSTPDLVFRVGAVIGRINQCSEMNDAHLGYLLFADMLDNPGTSLYVTDATGTEHRIRFNYTRYDDECESEKHNALIQTLINEDKVHFLFGSTPVFAEQESVLANKAQRLLYHCCVGPDPIYEMDMRFIYGIQASNTKYSLGAAKSMALAGDVKKLFIFYLEDNIFTSTTCQTAVTYSTDVLKQLSSEFGIVEVVKYTSANATADPNFYSHLVARAISVEAGPGFQVAKTVANRGYYLKALWLTVAPAYEDFAGTLGPKATEHVLTAVQWHPASTFADMFFGTAQEYSQRYDRAYGVTPSCICAAAACPMRQVRLFCCLSHEAGAFVLLLAPMRQISCPVLTSVVCLPHLPLQIQSGVLQATLPIDVANKALVMPKPTPVDEDSGTDYIGTLPREAFIAVVVVVVGSAIILCSAALLIMWRNKQHSMLLEHMLVVSPDDLLIINHPVLLCDGTYECGKALHRNTLVALEPLTEVKQKEMESNMRSQTKPLRRSSTRAIRSSSVPIVRESEPQVMLNGNKTYTSSNELNLSIQPLNLSNQPLNLSNQPINIPRAAYPEDDLEAPPIIFQGPVCEGVEGLRPKRKRPSFKVDPQRQHSTSGANGASALHGLLPTSLHSRSRVNFNFTKGESDDLDSCSQQPLRTSVSNANINLQGPETPQLTRTQILRLVWRSKCLQHPSILPVSGIMWSLPSVPPNMAVLVTECEELGALSSVMDNKLMELDALKMLDICKDLAQALAYLHAQTHPRLRPVLQPRLAGVMLNKHCRRIPAHGSRPPLSPQVPATAGSHWEELEDVQQFGLDIACMLSSGQKVAHMNGANCYSCNNNLHPASGNLDDELVEGSVLRKPCLESLVEEHGDELAQLVLQCCALDSTQRPTFTQVGS
ncbi:hypothetical protein DUNSADRAFT_11278 [Dunaliella salina]|uniref:Guanylate cyclase n=1 Tax=Dunaliella salina TaxID=3046 RepID=A0ABQ7GDP5_DUNSA|nr:hypothetical protein DUNSADRAFT_11278 [Dunaliella salina]|eukprot:KAF5832728.1 hypothetical protein DUNSADRAFT_11278 [Dunaliella salina]